MDKRMNEQAEQLYALILSYAGHENLMGSKDMYSFLVKKDSVPTAQRKQNNLFALYQLKNNGLKLKHNLPFKYYRKYKTPLVAIQNKSLHINY